MQQDLSERSQVIVAMLRSEMDRRSLAAKANRAKADRVDIARAVLSEMTPPGWRYQLYPTHGAEAPDFIVIPAAFAS